MSSAGRRASRRNDSRGGGCRTRPAAIVKMIAQPVLCPATVHAGADITVIGAAVGNGRDAAGPAGAIAVRDVDRRAYASVTRAAAIGTTVARPKSVERIVVDHYVGVLLIGIVRLI